MSAPVVYGLTVPRTVAEVLERPERVALIVYDAQSGVLSQLPRGDEFKARIVAAIERARDMKMRIIYTRHLHLPPRMLGVSGLRLGMAWQGTDDPSAVRPALVRDSPGFALAAPLEPRDDEVVFDKIAMSAFEGTPINTVLRDCGVSAFAICGAALEIGIEPTVHHGLDLGYIPIVLRDACGFRDDAAAQRALDGFAFTGTVLTTDVQGFIPTSR